MSDLQFCLICLCEGVKMYDQNQYNLKQYYEEVMGKKMKENDGLPTQFCYQCAAILHKFHKFKEKCYLGEKVLQGIKWMGPITLSSISLIRKQNINLQSTINLIVMSKRIRTCIVKYKAASKTLTKQKKGDQSKIKQNEIETDSSSNDKNLAEIETDITHINLDSIKQEITDEHRDILKEKVNSDSENLDLKSIRYFEEDKMLSDEKFTTEPDNIDDEKINQDNEQSNNEIAIEKATLKHQKYKNDNTKKKDKNYNTKKCDIKKKDKRFVNRDVTYGNLDPNHWLKINLSEEEAWEDFNSKALDQKYLSAAYRCSDCYKSFSKEDMLSRHFKLRHCESLGPIECRFCKMRFKWKCHLTKHITQHFTKYKCLRCETMCPLLTTAVFHNGYHNGVIKQCKYCGEEFRHPSTYYTHLRTHRSEHVCTLCGVSFVSVKGLKMHKKTMHVNTVVNPEEEVNTYCERCDVMFETRKAYEEHIFHSASHVEGVEDLAGETPGPSIPKRRRKTFKNPRISTPCTICNITFPSYTAFHKHCLAEHKDVRNPSQQQRYICEICGASLATNSVSAHLNTHTQEKLYHCPTCRMQFTTKSSMKRHQVTHTGEKPFKCTLCDKRFTQKTGVTLHYRTFHLKEPYPKRNRRQKTDIQSEDFRSSGKHSE